MRVALYQCPPLPLDVAGNLQRLHQLALEAKGADLLVVPEMFLTGYNIGVDAVSVAGYCYDASIHPTWLPGRYNNLHLPKTSYFDNELLRIPASVSPTLRIPLFWLSFKNFPFEYYKKLAIKFSKLS